MYIGSVLLVRPPAGHDHLTPHVYGETKAGSHGNRTPPSCEQTQTDVSHSASVGRVSVDG